MQQILFEFEMNATTWAYLSALLIIGDYFKFRRFWSVRNLDLIGLICFAPGLLLIAHDKEQLGYVWLFSVGGFFLVRLLIDPVMVRRPLLEPNLSVGGLVFAAVAMLTFLFANLINHGGGLTAGPAAAPAPARAVGQRPGGAAPPGPPLYMLLARVPSRAPAGAAPSDLESKRQRILMDATLCTTAIVGQLAIVLALVVVGYRHFDSLTTGMAATGLYQHYPYTALMTGEVEHVLPGALLAWAVAAYRRPILAGALLGWAIGMIYYPLFLLPLWCSFYWRRGLIRFAIGLLGTLAGLAVFVALTPGGWQLFAEQFQQMTAAHPAGFWQDHPAVYRIPVLAACAALCGSLALWPAQKNLGTLLSCSAAVMLGTQFCHAPQGGLYMAWHLPLVVLTIFRPNLEDRVAITALSERLWLWRRSRGPEKARPAAG